jgi:hypothetical protein
VQVRLKADAPYTRASSSRRRPRVLSRQFTDRRAEALRHTLTIYGEVRLKADAPNTRGSSPRTTNECSQPARTVSDTQG